MLDFMSREFNIQKIVFATFVPAGTGQIVHKNRPSHGIGLNLEGEKIYHFQGYPPVTVRKNSLFYMPKGSSYTVDIHIPGECYAINFDDFDPICFAPFSFEGKNANYYLDCFRQADTLWKVKPQGYQMKCKALLYDILFQMQKEFMLGYLPSSKSALLRPAMEQIHNGYTGELMSIEDLASLCGISPAYFRRLFISTYGTSPLKYINALRLTRAKELLESGLYSVHEVCELAGYKDDAYFSREFKKATGVSPSSYK